MPLDAKYHLLPSLQEVFRDQDTGLPLSGGTVTFWKDKARTIKKDIYQLSGTPPNYTYTPLSNPVTLSQAGTYQDGSGNDILIYVFPYDSSGNLELYYIEVKSFGGVPQFTREALPNLGITAEEEKGIQNFASNGQFLIQNYISDDGTVPTDIYQITPDNWWFARSGGSSSQDKITFERFGSYVANPTGNPRYVLKLECVTPSGTDTDKGLELRFRNVNKFASTTQKYTFAFTAKSDSGIPVIIKLIKFYGAGGTPADFIDIKTINTTNNYSTYNVSFIFGTNEGKTIGTNEDDYVSLNFACPPTTAFTFYLTNVALVLGDTEINNYPDVPQLEDIYKSIGGFFPKPNPDGSDLHLPIKWTENGYQFDTTIIGLIFDSPFDTPQIGELACNGQNYETATRSSDKIPYSRLYNKIKGSNGLGRWGTGVDKWTVNSAPPIVLTNNAVGAVTATADGSPATGFTFVRTQIGSSTLPEITTITTVAASSIPAGANFTFHVPTGSPTAFGVWYEVGGSGTEPTSPSAKWIKVVLDGSETAIQVEEKTVITMNGVYFAVQDRRGYFIRGTDGGVGRDPDAGSRTYRGDGTTGDNVGTYQEDEFEAHTHTYIDPAKINARQLQETPARSDGSSTRQTDATGGNETRPKNVYVNWVIKY